MRPDHCFWNGQTDTFYSYDPCQEVMDSWAGRVVVFEVQLEPLFDGQPPLIAPIVMYPTGRWMAISTESEILNHVPDKQAVLDEMRMSVDTELFELMAQASEEPDEPKAGSELPDRPGE